MDPGPHETHNHLIESVHRAIRTHPAPEAKANYAKMLATLLQQQAKAHAAAQQASQHHVATPTPQRPGGPEGIYGGGDSQVGPPAFPLTPPQFTRPGFGTGLYGEGQVGPPVVSPWAALLAAAPQVAHPALNAAVASSLLHHVPLPAWA